MHSHVLMDVKIFYNESGRLAKCKNVIYIADSFIENPSDDFSKWVQNQKDVLFLEKKQKNTNHYQFVLNDDAAQHFTPLPSKHKAKTTVPTKKLKGQFSEHTVQILVMKSNCFLLILTWQRIWATALKVV